MANFSPTAVRWAGWERAGRRNADRPSAPPPVTFPDVDIVTRVYIALGANLAADPSTWAWEEITQWVRYAPGITVTSGRRDEASTVTAGTARLTLDNRDGRFSRRNPLSPYFGLLTKNTPIWFQLDAGSGFNGRGEMFVNEWPRRWNKAKTDCVVNIACAGILRRLAQGAEAKSAMRRTIMGAARKPIAYWAMEDGAASTQVGSALPGGPSIAIIAPAKLSTTTIAAGTAGALDLSGSAPVSSGSLNITAGTFRLEAIANNGTTAFAHSFIRVTPRGAGVIYFVDIGGGDGNVYLTMIRSTDNAMLVNDVGLPAINVFDGQTRSFALHVSPSGANVTYSVVVDDVVRISGTVATGLATAAAPIDRVFLGGASTSPPTSASFLMSQFAIYDTAAVISRVTMMNGFPGEQAHVRIARLCAEEGIPYSSVASQSVTCGPQGVDTVLTLVREAEAADMGVLYEKRFGLAYQSSAERLNAAVALPLDFAAGHVAEPPEPADDDQRTRNRWKVSRTNGSEAIAEQTTGPMGTGPEGPGVYDDSTSVNVTTDDQLPDQAGWRLWLGTVDEDRYASVKLDFAATPQLIDTYVQMAYGSRITIANPPSQGPPDRIDAIVEGLSETWNPSGWKATLNTSPATPYRVGTLAQDSGDTSDLLGWLESDSCYLAVAVDATAVSWSVTSTPLWTTVADDFPCQAWIGGELVTITNCTGAAAPQTWTVTRSVNGVIKGHTTTEAISVAHPIVLTL